MSSEYHSALSPLSWLFGVWESVEAEVAYPTMNTLKFCEVMEYRPTDQPWLDYKSETWHPETKVKIHCEKGYLRIDPDDNNKIGFFLAHKFGATEVSEGTVDKECLNLESTAFSCMSGTNLVRPVKAVRKLELKGDELHYTQFLQTASQPLQRHVQCRYRKRK